VSEPLSPGGTFGEYDILDLAGMGGMGVVYRVRQRSLERTVALKLIRAEISADPGFRERFLREARLAAAVDHPHIVSIYDVGEREGHLFLAMQWIKGQDLASTLLRDGRLSIGRAVTICSQLAGALDSVHTAGLIHRDVKPANVLVRSVGGSDHAYLTDFGVARAHEPVVGLTEAGYVVGTAGFMAPEQIRGEPPGPYSDLYALGCVTFQCLTGRAPFEASNTIALMWAHAHDPRPSAGAINPALGDRFDAILAKALAIDPGERYGDGQDFARAMSDAARATPFAPTGAHPTVPARQLAGAAPPLRPSPAGPTPTPAVGPREPADPATPPDGAQSLAPGAGPPGRPDAPDRRTPPFGRRLALATVIGLVVAGAAAGALAAAGVFSSGAKHPPPPPNPPPGDQAGAVISTLHRYAAAFSNGDPTAMASVLAPTLTRTGVRPPAAGCHTDRGRASVLQAERTNFGGTYSFAGLSASEVQINGPTAAVATRYSISSGGSGAIQFVLVQQGGGWHITSISAQC
jgi:hypothetical protein